MCALLYRLFFICLDAYIYFELPLLNTETEKEHPVFSTLLFVLSNVFIIGSLGYMLP